MAEHPTRYELMFGMGELGGHMDAAGLQFMLIAGDKDGHSAVTNLSQGAVIEMLLGLAHHNHALGRAIQIAGATFALDILEQVMETTEAEQQEPTEPQECIN